MLAKRSRLRAQVTCLLAIAGVLLALTQPIAVAVGDAAWVRHNNPSGFVVEHPPKWTVEASAAAISVRSPDKKACMVVMSFSFENGGRSVEVLRSAPAVFGERFPKAKVVSVTQESVSPDISSGTISYSLGSGEGRADLICLVDGNSGVVFAMGAPKSLYAAYGPVLTRIQNSFARGAPSAAAIEKERPTPPGSVVSASAPALPNPPVPNDEVVLPSAAQPASPAPSPSGSSAGIQPDNTLQYVKWTDPVEKAFTAEIPKGWQVAGGTKRLSEIEARSAIEVAAPDGSIKLVVGDVAIGLFVTPDPVTQSMHLSEGQYVQSDGFKLQIMRYQGGKDFAKAYARGRAADDKWGDVKITSEIDRTDLEKAIRGQIPAGANVKVSSGEVRFTCSPGGRPATGCCIATTTLTSRAGTSQGLWQVNALALCLSPPEKAESSIAILRRVANSLVPSPEWIRMQQERATRASGASPSTGQD